MALLPLWVKVSVEVKVSAASGLSQGLSGLGGLWREIFPESDADEEPRSTHDFMREQGSQTTPAPRIGGRDQHQAPPRSVCS